MKRFQPLVINAVLIISLSGLIFFPFAGFAHFNIPESIVPCGTSETPGCQTCHLFELGHNIVDFLTWGIAGPLAGLMFIVSGFFIATAGDSPTRRQQGLKIFSSTLWGLAIVFFSWILINSIISIMGGQGVLGAWSSPPGAFCSSG